MCFSGSGTDIFPSGFLHPRLMNVFEWVGHGHFISDLFTEEGVCVSVGRAHAPSTFFVSHVRFSTSSSGYLLPLTFPVALMALPNRPM